MNTIKIYLKESGSIAEISMDFKLYVGSYQNKLINIFVPKSLLYSNQNNDFGNAVKIGGLLTNEDGSTLQTNSYYLDYLKDAIINNIEYSVFERRLPKEFTAKCGTILLTTNILSIDTSKIYETTLLEVITSQTCSLEVYKSAYLSDKDTMESSKYEEVTAKITKNQNDITSLETKMNTTEADLNTAMHSYNLESIDSYAIDYKGIDGYKTPRAIYTNYKNTVLDSVDDDGNLNKIEVMGSLLVTSFIYSDVIYQTECLFANGRIWVRQLEIDNKNYTNLNSAVFTPLIIGVLGKDDNNPYKLDKNLGQSNSGMTLVVDNLGNIVPSKKIKVGDVVIYSEKEDEETSIVFEFPD